MYGFCHMPLALPATQTVTIALGLICIAYALSFLRSLKAVNYLPGMRPLFSPTSLLGAVLPSCWWNLGHNWAWTFRKTSFFNHKHDIISMVPILHGNNYFLTCSVDVLKQVLGNESKTLLTKPQDLTLSSLVGDNIGSVSGDTWRRHRRNVAPAFNAKNNTLVVEETAKLYDEVVQCEGWDKRDTVVIHSARDFMLKYALIVVARCAFGLSIPWKASSDNTASGDMKLDQAIGIVTKTHIARLILPTLAFKLPIKSLRRIDNAWTTFTSIVHKSIEERKKALSGELDDKGDVLSRLIGSHDGREKHRLSDQEVVADVYTLLFAGHETVASVLTATMACLAIYKDEQLKAYNEIKAAFSEDGILIDSNSYPHLQACFQEAGRLFPVAFILARETPEDLPIKITRPKEDTIIIPKGSRIVFDLVSIYHNPYTYNDPEKFIPSRWYGVSEHDLPAFGYGPRACVGRKFAQMEAVSFLAHLLCDWEIDAALEEGESVAEYEEKVLGNAQMRGTAFSIGDVKLKMKKRISTTE